MATYRGWKVSASYRLSFILFEDRAAVYVDSNGVMIEQSISVSGEGVACLIDVLTLAGKCHAKLAAGEPIAEVASFVAEAIRR